MVRNLVQQWSQNRVRYLVRNSVSQKGPINYGPKLRTTSFNCGSRTGLFIFDPRTGLINFGPRTGPNKIWIEIEVSVLIRAGTVISNNLFGSVRSSMDRDWMTSLQRNLSIT